MADIVQTLRSFTPAAVPAAGTLLEGQLAVNIPDKKIWIGNTDGDPVIIFNSSNVGVSDHTQLTNIGTNTHDQIDAHIAATDNPHSVTPGQIGAAPADHTHEWADITDPPATFPPAAHTHVLADITDAGSMAAVDDAASDGLFYGRKDGAWAEVTDFGPEDVKGGQGISVVLPGDGTVEVHSTQATGVKAVWLWSDLTTGDPGNGNMRGDNVGGGAITAFGLSYQDKDGADVSPILATIKTGDQLQIVRDNAGVIEYSVWNVDALPVDQTTYADLPVTLIFESSTDTPDVGDEMNVQWTPQETYVPAHQHDHNTDLTNVGTNTHVQIDNHIANVSNPHNVTYEQLGGTQPPPVAHVHSHNDLDPASIGTNNHATIDAHLANTSNPHQVTYEQLGGTQPPPVGHNHDAGTFTL